jgi:hypothetical protein
VKLASSTIFRQLFLQSLTRPVSAWSTFRDAGDPTVSGRCRKPALFAHRSRNARRRMRDRRDWGSISLFLAVGALGVFLCSAFLVRSGGSLVQRAKADAAAEAAALAAAMGLDPGWVAGENGASLVEVRQAGSSGNFPRWHVEVRVGGVASRAAATLGFGAYAPGRDVATSGLRRQWTVATSGLRRQWSDVWGSSLRVGLQPTRQARIAVADKQGGRRAGLHPDTLFALERADSLLEKRGLPSPIPVVSGLRTYAEQMQLWIRRGSNPYPVARPGTSAHELGLAIDVPASWVPLVLAVAAEAGLCQPFPQRDPIHFGPLTSPECGGKASGMRPRPFLVATKDVL